MDRYEIIGLGIPMNAVRSRRVARIWFSLMLCALLPALSGCSAISSTTRLDISPFADGTIAVTRDIRYQMAGIASVYIRPHIRGIAVQKAEGLADEGRIAIRSIIEYSVNLSKLAGLDAKPTERTNAYADLFMRLALIPIERGWSGYDHSPEAIREIATEAASQERLLDAVRIAHPVVEDFVFSVTKSFDGFETAFDEAIGEILRGIETEHRQERQVEDMVRKTQLLLMQDGLRILEFQSGNEAALDSLIGKGSYLKDFKKAQAADSEALARIEAYIMERLQFAGKIIEDLQPGRELYHNQLAETEEISRQIRQKLQQARIALLLWRRAHGELASGITDPAKINIGKIAKSIMTSVP